MIFILRKTKRFLLMIKLETKNYFVKSIPAIVDLAL